MGILNSLRGCVTIELTSADTTASLRAINELRIPITDLCTVNDLSIQFTVLRRYLKQIQRLAERKGDQAVILSRKGLFWRILDLNKRPVLFFGITVLFALALFLPTRVLFVEVDGNELVSDNLILETAREVGIDFGASRRAVRSEKMKNRLLGQLPQLQWAGVNTYGCTAVISVTERAQETKNENRNNFQVSNIVASNDGVITSCVITGGSGLCDVGQVVKKGQVLISGYTDCGGVVTAGRSRGEIFAQTRHKYMAVSPAEVYNRAEALKEHTRYSVRIGKKRINFYNGSGIYDASCVKMIKQYHLTLPGDYVLPITIIKEIWTSYHSACVPIDENQLAIAVSQFSRSYIRESGIALTIVDAQEVFEIKNGLAMLNGVYGCTEMIGREQGIQIGDFHGKTD